MTLAAVQTTRTFRQFRVAVFGVSIFLRLGWAFLLALTAFSLTTLVDKRHQIITLYLFAANNAAFVAIVLVGTFEAFKFGIASWTSRVGVELTWLALCWIVETAGAVTLTIFHPTFHCDTIMRIYGDATGVIFGSTLPASSIRSTTAQEATTCKVFNQITFIGSWITVGLSLLYLAYFALLALSASRRNRLVWRTPVNRFDWSITSEPVMPNSPDIVYPDMIERPQNPHLSKDWNDSMTSLPPVFVNPFEFKKASFDSAATKFEPLGPQYNFEPMDRHRVMAQYQPAPYPSYPEPVVLADEAQPNTQRHSILGLEGMDVQSNRKSKPTLSIYVPPQPSQKFVPIGVAEEGYDRIGRVMSIMVASPQSLEMNSPNSPSEGPCAKIGQRMSRPFASPISSDESHATSVGKENGSSTKGTVSHHSLYTKSHGTEGHDLGLVQTVEAANGYPVIQQTPKRQSTLVRHDSLTMRMTMRYAPQPAVPSFPQSAVLPTQIQGPQSLPRTARSANRGSVLVKHQRSSSAMGALQPPPRVPVGTWAPGPSSTSLADRVQLQRPPSAFHLHIPPPPTYSPVTAAKHSHSPASSISRSSAPATPTRHSRAHSSPDSAYNGSLLGGSNQSQSRSSSVVSTMQHTSPTVVPPIPALLNALSPVLRDSGVFQYPNGTLESQQYQQQAPSLQASAVRSHAFLDDNPFGLGSNVTTHTPDRQSFEGIAKEFAEEKKTRRASRLRKSAPRY